MKYVIIGNSAAGIGGAEGIRRQDAAGDITIITNEPHHTYSRPLISYLLEGKTDRQRMKYRPDDFYQTNRITLLQGNVAKLEAGQVVLETGEKVPFDKLLVATGSSPFLPPMAGLERVQKRFSFMTLNDANALEQALFPEARVLIVGAGLIGLKAAEGIHHRVDSITVVDLADRILPSILNEAGSARVRAHIESRGVQLITGTSVQEFSEYSARLQTGETVDFDILITAVGVRPNVSLVKEAGGQVNRGIVTNEYQLTSLPDVYAAGDCTESLDTAAGQQRILAILPNAYRQGECAGVNMAGGSMPYTNAIAMNAIGFFGLHMITAGSYEGDALLTETDTCYKCLFVKDGFLKGFILIGCVERAGIYTAMIKDRVPVAAVDFELLKEQPQLLAYSSGERKAMLSAAH